MKIKKKWLVIFLLPATLIFALVYAVPVVMLTATSFTDWVAVSSPHFNGIDNYIKLFQNSQFLHATVNTLIWMVLQSTVHIFIGVLTALILARKKFYWKFTRTVYMFPNIISSAAIGMLFVMLLNPSFGIVNKGLEALGFQNLPNWFSNSSTAFFAVTITWLPFAATVTILVMAEMTSLESLYSGGRKGGWRYGISNHNPHHSAFNEKYYRHHHGAGSHQYAAKAGYPDDDH
ncbi:MAG: carbohydrate ABC transporter permease [[Clostridium] leptum]